METFSITLYMPAVWVVAIILTPLWLLLAFILYTIIWVFIEQFVFVCHSKITKKQLIERWSNAVNEKHPVLIIATGLFLSLPRTDINTIIINEESSTLYKSKNAGRNILTVYSEDM